MCRRKRGWPGVATVLEADRPFIWWRVRAVRASCEVTAKVSLLLAVGYRNNRHRRQREGDMDPGEAVPADLHIDVRNPRVPEEEFSSETEALKYLVNHADVDELVQSIGRSGWLDFEPLIVLRPSNTVIEGNRRLAALRLIADEGLRNEIGFRLPAGVEAAPMPGHVQVFFVDSRADARAFIGFKHINGAYKWDSFAKAKYADEWLADDPGTTVKDVSERLGDSHNTVLRLVNGYRVLREAEQLGFRTRETTAPRGFSFSHLYTALPSPAVRTFLGISADAADLLPVNPVPASYHDALMEYMTWLYGQVGRGRNVITSQNPDLGKLTRVLSSNLSIGMLRESHNLDEAYNLVEDKGKAFAEAMFALLKASRMALSQVGKYDGDLELLQVAQSTSQNVRSLVAGMNAAIDEQSTKQAGPTP